MKKKYRVAVDQMETAKRNGANIPDGQSLFKYFDLLDTTESDKAENNHRNVREVGANASQQERRGGNVSQKVTSYI